MAIPPLSKAVLQGGLLGGALHLLYAVSFATWNGAPPSRLFQTIASGLLGSEAFAGGMGVQALGIFCHFALALAWAAAFAVVAAGRPAWVQRPFVTAVVFGCIVLLGMRLIVLPLSAYPRPITFAPLATVLDLLSHMFLFALPIVLAVARALNGRRGAALASVEGGR